VTVGCPSNETIAELVCRQLAAPRADEVEGHVADCATCRRVVGVLARSSLPRLAAIHSIDDEPPATVLLRAGAMVGRYRILGLLGAGGMGVVYRAHDPELDRSIAIKLLHPELAADPEAARTLLLAEAQVMAKLRHPNVVAVHDVGTHGDLVFIAMELIEGETLRSWLAEPRSWRDVVRVLVDAGRGLAAAHAQGIVHRDFKPENVLIGAADQVCVADFGLARPAGATGDVGGTPKYMAPEQRAGQPPDPRADQYSYCAVLDEALRATRSSTGERLARRFAKRGLAADPDARYPSMDALLAHVARYRASIRRRWMVAAAAVLVVGAAGATMASRGSIDPCETAAEAPTIVGSNVILAAFSPDVARRVDDRLAAWRTRVGAMRGATCHASRVAGTESSELSDLRMECIADSVRRVSALEDAFAKPTKALVGNALAALDRASDLSACESRRAVLEPLRAPDDPSGRARFEALRTQLAAATAADDSGRADAAAAAADIAVRARADGFHAIEAEAWHLAAMAQFHAEQPLAARESFQRAIVAAESAGYDVLRGALYLELVATEDSANAAKLIAQGKALADRLGDPHLRWQVMFAEANAACAAQDFARCAQHCQAVLADRGPIEDRVTAEVTESLSGALFLSGHRDEGLAAEHKAIAIFEKLYGPDSPTMIDVLAELGDELGQVGRLDESVDALEKAIAIAERAGLAMPELAAKLADTLLLVDRAPEAVPLVDRAIAASEQSLGKTSMRYAWVLLTRAKVLARVDRLDDAIRDGTDAIAIMRGDADANANGGLASPLTILADLQARRGRLDDAIRSLEEAIRIYEHVPSNDHYGAESELGWVEYLAHRPADARAHYERALALLAKLDQADPTEVAASEVGVARCLLALGADHARTVALLHAAHDTYAATGRFTPQLDEIAALLAGRAPPLK
jgi:tetratricopeptide (TPR) repeat protein